MHSMQLNGRLVNFEAGQTLLEVARANEVPIPTLCHHPGLESHGGCRLCVVEVTRAEWDGWWRMVSACEFPAADDLIVATESERLSRTRRNVVDLLLARCPETPFTVALGRDFGLAKSSLAPRAEPDDCILCGLCVRVCAAVGAHAIAGADRGVHKQVGPPYAPPSFERPPGLAPAGDCIGCLCCAEICPTGHIRYENNAQGREIWGRSFRVVECASCGAPLGTPEQLDHFAARSGLSRDYFERCDACSKLDTARAFDQQVMGEGTS